MVGGHVGTPVVCFGYYEYKCQEGAWSEGGGDRGGGREGTPSHSNHSGHSHGHKRTQSGHVGGHVFYGHVKHCSASLPRDTSGHGSAGHGSAARSEAGDSGESDVTSESEGRVAAGPAQQLTVSIIIWLET